MRQGQNHPEFGVHSRPKSRSRRRQRRLRGGRTAFTSEDFAAIGYAKIRMINRIDRHQARVKDYFLSLGRLSPEKQQRLKQHLYNTFQNQDAPPPLPPHPREAPNIRPTNTPILTMTITPVAHPGTFN